MAEKVKWKTVGSSTTTPLDNMKRKEVVVKGPAPNPQIQAKILEVSWKSGINVTNDGRPVAAPHWMDGVNVNEADAPPQQKWKTGSLKPGVYLVKGKGADTIELKVEVTSTGDVGDTGIIRGLLGELLFEGNCPTKSGVHTVTVKITNLPITPQHYEGSSVWIMKVPKLGTSIRIGMGIRLEMFVIFNNPAKFYGPGVWAEALRFLFKRVKLAGSEDNAEVFKKVTAYCHTGHGMRYDTVNGAPSFGVKYNGGVFKLLSYMNKSKTVVNCFDQAAAVQSLVGAVGCNVQWVFMYPFGFINTTNLVGVGQCNNPFYETNGTLPVIADRFSSKRTSFDNHAFIAADEDRILDACAGPHTGNDSSAKLSCPAPHFAIESLPEYIENAIDAEASKGALKLSDARVYRAVVEKQAEYSPGVSGLIRA